jgi:Sec23/Sec24 zinc finger
MAAVPPPAAEPFDPSMQEDLDGISFSWNTWPTTRIEASRTVVPIGAIYTPLKTRPADFPPVEYPPVVCKCKVILNPYCGIDIASRTWTCQVHTTITAADVRSFVLLASHFRTTMPIFNLEICHWSCNHNSRRLSIF